MIEPIPTQWDANDQLEALLFDIGDETFALEAVMVQEIFDLLPETRIPGAPLVVGSIVNFRGRILPVADLALAFGMSTGAATIDSRIVVIELRLEGERMQVGIRANKVRKVTTLDRDASECPPVVGMRWRRDYVRELIRGESGIIIIPDLPTIFRSILVRDDLSAALAGGS